MSNPVDDYLLEKKALGLGDALNSPFSKTVAKGLGLGTAFAVGSAGVAGIVGAAGKLFDAATKKRDFEAMLETNPHLKVYQEREPETFNNMFTAIRALNPEFTKEPMVAAAYMFDAMEGPPETRGLIAVKALNQAGHVRPGPMSEAAMEGFNRGIGMKIEGGKSTLAIPRRASGPDQEQEDDLPAY